MFGLPYKCHKQGDNCQIVVRPTRQMFPGRINAKTP